MAILDVSLVTKAIRRLLEESVKNSPAWNPRPDPTVSVLPPDKLKSGSLGLYLYHVAEDSHFKNQPAAGTSADPVPVRHNPMGLNLFYLLTTDGVVDEDNKVYDAQLLLGLALKTLHDYPELTDKTKVHGLELFEAVGLSKTDTRLKISMQPLAHNEAVTYWTAGQSPLRLSAYYQVYVILLEPEKPPTRTGRVLDFGVHTFVGGSPRLTGSRNTLSLILPATGTTQEVELRPAEVPIGSPVEFTGANLTGDETNLIIKSGRWSQGVTAGLGWGVIAKDDRVQATVREIIDGTDILPGIYSAAVQVVNYRLMPDGSRRAFANTSNETPFTITPRIETVGAPDGAGNVEIKGHVFQHPDIKVEQIQVFLGALPLTEGLAGALNPGEYAVVDEETLELRLAADTAAGHLPFRLLINGAESPPAWIKVP